MKDVDGSPSSSVTPRTRQRREVISRRLQYFQSAPNSADNSCKSSGTTSSEHICTDVVEKEPSRNLTTPLEVHKQNAPQQPDHSVTERTSLYDTVLISVPGHSVMGSYDVGVKRVVDRPTSDDKFDNHLYESETWDVQDKLVEDLEMLSMSDLVEDDCSMDGEDMESAGKTRGGDDTVDINPGDISEEALTGNLEDLLGKDRFERLIKNLQDTEGSVGEFASEGGIDEVQNSTRSVSSETNVNESWAPTAFSTDDYDVHLQLETHRPDSPMHESLPSYNKPVHVYTAQDIYAQAEGISKSLFDVEDPLNNYQRDDEITDVQSSFNCSNIYDDGESDVHSTLVDREVYSLPRKSPFGPIPKAEDIDWNNYTTFKTSQENTDFSQERRVPDGQDNVDGTDELINGFFEEGRSVREEADGEYLKPRDDFDTVSSVVISEVNEDNANRKLKKLGIDFDISKGKTIIDQFKSEVEVFRPPQGTEANSRTEHDLKPTEPVPSQNSPRIDKSRSSTGASSSLVRVCPECACVNTFSAMWCEECETSLACVKPVPSKLKKPRGIPSVDTSVDSTKPEVVQSTTDASETFSEWCRKEGFITSQDTTSQDTLVLPCAAELSLNLRDSSDSYFSNPTCKTEESPKKSKSARTPVVDLSDDVVFEYQDCDKSQQSLPEKIKLELSLNLRDSTESLCSTAMEKTSSKVKSNVSNCVAKQAADGSQTKQGKVQHPTKGQGHSNDQGENKGQGNCAEDDDEETEEREHYQEFVNRLATDPRFNKASGDDTLIPAISGLPKKSKRKSQPLNKSKNFSSNSGSKMRSSMEIESFPRRWATSSVSWSTFKPGQLNKPSSLYPASSSSQPNRARPTSAHVQRPKSSGGLRERPQSAGSTRSRLSGECSIKETASYSAEDGNQVRASVPGNKHKGRVLRASQGTSQVFDQVPEPPTSKPTRPSSAKAGTMLKSLVMPAVNRHAKYLAMSPRIHRGEVSMMSCLPDEILLTIFSYLTPPDLYRCAQVCHHLRRVALDTTLWRYILVKKRTLKDDWLVEIGRRQPASLSLIQCRGDSITEGGLRELFRQCSDGLQELNITGCGRGLLTGDNLLLHAGGRCANITHLDASWCAVTDSALTAFSDICHRLRSLCINGTQSLNDAALLSVLTKHGPHLETLETFGCFNITSESIKNIARYCRALVTLNLGQCWKVSDDSLAQLTYSLPRVEHLDLRGCKQLQDSTVHLLMRNCRSLTTLSLANCPSITDSSLAEIAALGSNIRSLDVNGCRKVTNTGVKSLAQGTTQLQFLDISSTAANNQSVTALASYSNRHLEVLKLNFCKTISINSLLKLVKHCKRLKKLYLYGVNGIREHNVHDMKVLNPNLWLEM